ncbi:MAG: ParB/RepB/Spo0J family partition protein [Proteobacteria bacterium]|nr:ParB/RepB/Spo0J family partition protein [Pseudomonadota bacterium]
MKRRQALGRGLSALIPDAADDKSQDAPSKRDFFACPIDRIHPRPDQPRQLFKEESLRSLVESIREQGVIQPVIVRRRTNGDGYELIAGERRWKAAQLAGLKELQVVLKEASTAGALEMALVENIQREDLNPIEEAEAFKRLIEEHSYTQAELAKRIGRDRSTVANSLRLLVLPTEVRGMVINGALTEGHARALLQANSSTNMVSLARLVASKSLSVRETERRSRMTASNSKNEGAKAKSATASQEVRSLVERLQRALGARVKIVDRKGKGRMEIAYTSYDELDRILDKILK